MDGCRFRIRAVIYRSSDVGMLQLNISLPVALNDTVVQTSVSVIVYIVTIALAVYAPWRLLGQKLTWEDVGLGQSLPRWRDIGLAPVMLVFSLIATGIVMYVANLLLPAVDLETQQQIGFENLTQRYEMLLAFSLLWCWRRFVRSFCFAATFMEGYVSITMHFGRLH